jgi:hypothetical protein
VLLFGSQDEAILAPLMIALIDTGAGLFQR